MEFLKNLWTGKYSNIARIFVVVGVIGLVIASPKIYHAIWPTPYVSNQDSFKIVFPGNPTITTTTSNNEGSNGLATGRIYNFQNKTTGKGYSVYVIHYTKLDSNSLTTSETLSALQYEAEQLAQIYNAKLSNGKTITFRGIPAVSATITPIDQSYASTDLLAFIKNHNLYVILGSNLSTSSFESFTNSFNFVN